MINKKSRFVHVNGSILIHCPVCRGVVLKIDKEKAGESENSITSRCPHCYEQVQIVLVKDKKGILDIAVGNSVIDPNILKNKTALE